MPDLKYCISSHDLGFLQIVADFWGLTLQASDARSALPKLTQMLLVPSLVLEVVEALPGEARKAIDALIVHEGWLPWSRFTREFGPLRDMGPGKRDREKPFLEPTSASEILWYRGLIGRDFLRHDGELEECAYIPEDLLALMPPILRLGHETPGRAASPDEQARVILASDRVLDHACTLLAALRMGDPLRSPAVQIWQPPQPVVHALLVAMKLITSSEQLVAEDARPFLEMPRGAALTWLASGWQNSKQFNDLWLMPGVICEGSWQNDPVLARQRIIAFLSEIPEGRWWHLESFINTIYKREPDFQRPAGDFDTWLVRDAATGESLVGLQHWDAIDGALVRYIITGPMHWLGFTDLATREEDGPVTAFRLSKQSEALFLGKPITGLPHDDQPIEVFSDGKLIAGTHTSRLARYQVSRFCHWVAETNDQYTYQLSPSSLEGAAEQGLKIIHLRTLLKKYGETFPPSLDKALKLWEQIGEQAQIYQGMVLQVNSQQILQALRDSPASRFIDELLGPTAAIIQPGAVDKVAAALARLGYLAEVKFLGEIPDDHREEQL
jgi:hypothetical protein